jgi:hypothetical protein
MKKKSYYTSLPDFMSVKNIYFEFLELLGDFETKKNDGTFFLKGLLELSDRQWHTYSLLDNEIKERIEKCLLYLWDGNDLERTEEIISIMASLGLEGISSFLGTRSCENVSPEVFNEISLALSELGDSVSDPYSGM